GGGGGPQDKAARIFLVLSLELRDFLGEFSRTDDQQSRGQRVQGTGMADFEFLEVEFLADGPFQGVDRLEGTPFQGFVDQDELTFQYSFLVDQKKFLWYKDTDLSPNAPPHGDRYHDQPVDGKIGQLAPAYQFDHPGTGCEPGDKGGDKTGTYGHCLVPFKGNLPIHKVLGHLAQDQGDHHQKGKTCGFALVHSQEHGR